VQAPAGERPAAVVAGVADRPRPVLVPEEREARRALERDVELAGGAQRVDGAGLDPVRRGTHSTSRCVSGDGAAA
jgi:hypothetical protein